MVDLKVDDIVDHDDGSATITMTMDYDTLLMFARKGILATLREAADTIIETQENEE